MDQKITVRKVGDYFVDLGYAINILAEDRTPTQFLSSAYITNEDSYIVNENNQQRSTCQILKNSESAASTLLGNIEITADLSKIAEIECHNKVSFKNDSSKSDLSKAFTSYAITSTRTLRIANITDDDIIKASSHKITHIVTAVHCGKSLSGILTLSSTDKSNQKNIESDLRAAVSNLPIGGGSVSEAFQKNLQSSHFEFSSELIVLGQSAKGGLLSNADLDAFTKSITSYFDVDATASKTVVGYILTPISGIKSLASYAVLKHHTIYTQQLNYRIKDHLLHLNRAMIVLPGVFERLIRSARFEGNGDWEELWMLKKRFASELQQQQRDIYDWMDRFYRLGEEESTNAGEMINEVYELLNKIQDYRISRWQFLIPQYQKLSDLFDESISTNVDDLKSCSLLEKLRSCWSALTGSTQQNNPSVSERDSGWTNGSLIQANGGGTA